MGRSSRSFLCNAILFIKKKLEQIISRILFPRKGDGHSSRIWVTSYLQQLTRGKDGQLISLLFSLASGGVYQAICITTNTGGLLHHRFTLTHLHVRSIFCGTNPADFSGWVLPTTLLCEVRTFLGVLRQRGDPGDSSVVKDTTEISD